MVLFLILQKCILTGHPLLVQIWTTVTLFGHAYELGSNKTVSYSTILDSKSSAKHVYIYMYKAVRPGNVFSWILTVFPIYDGHSSNHMQHKKEHLKSWYGNLPADPKEEKAGIKFIWCITATLFLKWSCHAFD